MKTRKQKLRWLRTCNGLLSGALALLGFTACDSIGGDTPVEYGMPHADYEIKGKVVNKETQEAIGNVHVIMKPMDGKEVNPSAVYDTLRTDSEGAYQYEYSNFPQDGFRIVCQDPSGTYQADSTEVTMNPEGGDGHWYQGSDSQEVNFELEKKSQE